MNLEEILIEIAIHETAQKNLIKDFEEKWFNTNEEDFNKKEIQEMWDRYDELENIISRLKNDRDLILSLPLN